MVGGRKGYVDNRSFGRMSHVENLCVGGVGGKVVRGLNFRLPEGDSFVM